MASQKRDVYTLENNSSDFRHMKIGSTFDCVACKPCDMLPRKQCSDIVEERISSCKWNIIEVKNKKSLHESFGFRNTMSLKVSAGQVNAGCMASFEKSLDDESDKRWLMFDCRFETMKETLQSKPKRKKHGHYGTHYVRSLVRGGKVFILCQMSSDATIESYKSKLDLSTTFGFSQRLKLAEQSSNLHRSSTAKTEDDLTNIQLYSTVRTTKKPTTSSEVYSFIETFQEEVCKEKNFEPVQFELYPFEDVNSDKCTDNFKEFNEAYEDLLETERKFSEFIHSDTIQKIDESGKELMHTFHQDVKRMLSKFNEVIRKANMEVLGADATQSLIAYRDFISDNASEALSLKALLAGRIARLSGSVDRLERLLPTVTEISQVNDLIVLVVGHTGSGKTALIEFLAKGTTGGGARTADSGTEKFEKVESTFEGNKITYLDTPGFYDTDKNKTNLSHEEITKAFEVTRGGCDIILLVVNVHHSRQKTKKVFTDLKYYHGYNIAKHIIVVFTFTENVTRMKLNLDSMKADDRWKTILDECGNRAIGIDSAEMTTKRERYQVLKCLSVIMNRLHKDESKTKQRYQMQEKAFTAMERPLPFTQWK